LCKDPCLGACGINTECRTVSHVAMCYCYSQYTGDPFTQCTIQPRKLFIVIFLLKKIFQIYIQFQFFFNITLISYIIDEIYISLNFSKLFHLNNFKITAR
jgi:hypothetical protein